MPNPSIKDEETYQALRDDGASKEKAARIANAKARDGSKAVGRRGGQAEDYEDRTKDELIERARELDIEVTTKMRKGEIIDALRNH